MVNPYSPAKNRVIHQREWMALSIFFSLLGALIVIAYINQSEVDAEVISKLLIDEENHP